MENKNELALFQAWFKTVMTGIAKSTGEQFFIGLTFIGSRRMRKESLVPTKLYTNWGYLGSDYLFNKKKPTRTISQKSSRINVLNELIRHKQRFTVKDYIAELGQSITIRQAQRDLKSHNCLKKIGNTRGTFYVPVF